MAERMTNNELIEKIYREGYNPGEDAKDLRLIRVRVNGREMSMAHVIRVSREEVYTNLALNIGVHAGEVHNKEAIGIIDVTPWESVVIAADMALKYGDVDIGFMDRFSGTVIFTGRYSDVQSAVYGIHDYFKYTLNFTCCEVTER
ncbi:MAG: BMC domain-containing protein [Lachnospiraceae bacterium]|nr:BMC domain-containing protein [Lachnospiraceae bacterium]